jgi:preprotein translocase subunit SecG
MYIFMIIIHVIVCLVLIAVVLLQAGRGGGMSDMIGSGQPQSLFGTQTNEFMTRATEVCAIVFVITSLALGIMSTQRGKSLVERRMALRNLTEMAKSRPAAMPATKDPLEVNAAQVPPPQTPAVKQALDQKAADPSAPPVAMAPATTTSAPAAATEPAPAKK